MLESGIKNNFNVASVLLQIYFALSHV